MYVNSFLRYFISCSMMIIDSDVVWEKFFAFCAAFDIQSIFKFSNCVDTQKVNFTFKTNRIHVYLVKFVISQNFCDLTLSQYYIKITARKLNQYKKKTARIWQWRIRRVILHLIQLEEIQCCHRNFIRT